MEKINSSFGACMVSRNIYEGKGRLKWCIREKSVRDADNGWRFLSEIDTDEYLADKKNWCVLAYETLIDIEPAILPIYNMPVGTELTLLYEDNKKTFVDRKTGEPVELLY